MALNLSDQRDVTNISFGSGVLYLGPVGTTPSDDVNNDVGVITTASLQITRTKIEAFGGFPETLLVQYVRREDVTFSATGIEWNLARIRQALAAGRLTTSGPHRTNLGFGGDVNLLTFSLEFVHQLPRGGTAVMRIWQAQGTGDLNLTLGGEIHEFPQQFRAVDSVRRWGAETVTPTIVQNLNPSDARLLEIERIAQP